MGGQRRGRAIATTADERDALLRTRPISKVATVTPDGRPHQRAVVPVGRLGSSPASTRAAASSGTTADAVDFA
ncbi:hypothetical protein ACFHW2_17300 [Actinomadura sp. LOL_016]|uniref:hypothetical protein n=1 Tax=unclassified Actinomadura TaxID=2626254 RepID=UPI003A801121